MRTRLLAMAAAASVLATAQAAQAAPSSQIREFLAAMVQRAETRIDDAGVRLDSGSVKVRVQVGVDGRLTPPQVIKSSGSRATDLKVEAALRRMPVYAPPGLTGRTVTLTLGGGRGMLAQLDPQPHQPPPAGTRIPVRPAFPPVLRPDAAYVPNQVSAHDSGEPS